MVSPPVSELSTRARDIFRLVVEGYLSSGQPVGSKTLAGDGGLNLSPASIRSVLAELEGLGLLAAPHTSAGRMPTDTGLRLFVDGMMQVAEPSAEERRVIQNRLAAPGPIEAALEATSALLSDISGAAGMVMVPRREPRLVQLSLVPLSPTRALAVLVGEDGAIENRVLELDGPTGASTLEAAGNYITGRLAGRTLAEAVAAMRRELSTGRSQLDDASRDLVERGLAVWSQDAAQRPVLIVRGAANLLDESALGDIERVRRLLDDLEDKQAVAELLEFGKERGIDPNLHWQREPAVRIVGVVGDRQPLSRPRGEGGRRARGDRADAVELRAGRPHGGFHGPLTGQIDRITTKKQ